MGLALFDAPAWWGMLGAFPYAAPRLLACVFAAKEHQAGTLRCWAEFVVAMATGAIMAAAFGPWVQVAFRHGSPEELRGICSMIGLLSNRVAPMFVDNLSGIAAGVLTGRIAKALKGDEK
jgi:hypothetical protein